MDWIKWGKKLLYLPVWWMALLSVTSAAALTAVFSQGWTDSPLAYAAYAVSFYTLVVVTVFCVTEGPRRWRCIMGSYPCCGCCWHGLSAS